ncbi:hypothetical protein [Puniceibacterium confluentis]|nr:hypothetical protein [Puniceibacterium confluentis]
MTLRHSLPEPEDVHWTDLLFAAFSGWSLTEQSLESLIDRIGRVT